MKTVLYCCPCVPGEWIAAHRLRPRRLTPCGGDLEADASPAGRCGFCRAFERAAATAPDAVAVVFTTRCDQMRRGAGLFARRQRLPVFLFDLPATWQTRQARRLYLDELLRLGRFLESVGGTPPDDNRLAETLLAWDAGREALREARGRLSARAHAEAIRDFHERGDGSLAGEIRATRSAEPPGPIGSATPVTGAIPLALIGGPLLADQFDLFDAIEQAGGQVVLNGLENGERGLAARVDRRSARAEAFLAMAEATLDGIPDARQRPNSPFYRWLRERLDERGARGIVLYRHPWCDLWHAELARLRDWSRLPVLDLEASSDGRNDGRIDARARGRIDALIEMLR